jgi:hypothetical protein
MQHPAAVRTLEAVDTAAGAMAIGSLPTSVFVQAPVDASAADPPVEARVGRTGSDAAAEGVSDFLRRSR